MLDICRGIERPGDSKRFHRGNFLLLNKQSRILVTGHTGMLGKALVRALRAAGYEIILAAAHAECDLTDSAQVGALFERLQPEFVFHLAARVGGIKANTTFPADFLYENLAMQNNVIRECHRSGVKKLVFVRELADLIAGAAGYDGRIAWDSAMPDGMPRKCVDVSRIAALGYRPRIGLAEGIKGVVQQYRELKKKGVYP